MQDLKVFIFMFKNYESNPKTVLVPRHSLALMAWNLARCCFLATARTRYILVTVCWFFKFWLNCVYSKQLKLVYIWKYASNKHENIFVNIYLQTTHFLPTTYISCTSCYQQRTLLYNQIVIQYTRIITVKYRVTENRVNAQLCLQYLI